MAKQYYQKVFSISVLFYAFCVSVAKSELPFPVYRIKEVEFSGGVAGATSYHSDHWRPENGFKKQQPTENGWHIGGHDTTNKEAGNPPVMIWYDFKSDGIRAAEVALQPAQKGEVNGAPSSYQFVGSNDAVCNDGATWTVLCEDTSDRKWRSVWEVRYCKVKPEMTEKFRCLGIRALANHRPTGWMSMRNIRMWKRIEAHSEEDRVEL